MNMNTLDDMPDEEKVAQMYEAVLDHLLTKPDIKEKLTASMSMEKKWQFVKMNDIFDNSGSSGSGWGSKQNVLLASIEKAKTPDISNLKRLKASLQFANKEFMEGFLSAGGVSVLLKAIESRLTRRPVTELDVAILYEIMTCCKAIMNNAVGMEGFMAVKGAVDILARCLRFDYRLFAIQMLEILSVCCYYSDSTASLVVGGMRLLARSQNEAPFACLSRALVQQDIEVKAAVMQFVNSMVMGVVDTNAHALLRSDLNSVLLGESYDQAMTQVETEMELLAQIEQEAEDAGEGEDTFDMQPLSTALKSAGSSAANSPVAPSKPTRGAFRRLSVSLMNINGSPSAAPAASSPVPIGRASSLSNVADDTQQAPMDRVSAARRASILKTKSITTLHGPRAISEQKLDAMLKSPNALAALTERGTLSERDTDLTIEAKVNGRVEKVTVNPLMGSMQGSLTALKNTDKMESKLKDLLGGKKTKRRWYEVDAVSFKWCAGHEKEAEYKGIVPVSSITDIRNYSTDAVLTATNPHSFEFETVERVFALGCETADEKDSWVTALQVSRDSSIMVNGSYKYQTRELTSKDLVQLSQQFKKQGKVFQSIAIEDRREALANSGVNLSDVKCVADYLRSEALAAGHSDMLLGIMQELLLIPQGSRGTWEAMYAGAKFLIERSGRDAASGEEAFGDNAVVSLLNKKAVDGGGAYSQMSKLAMAAMESEQEATRLRTTVSQLEAQVAQLKQELDEMPVHRSHPRGSVFGVTNPLLQAAAATATAAAVVTQDKASVEKVDAATNTIEEAAAPVVLPRRKAPPPPPKPTRDSVKVTPPAEGPPPVPAVPAVPPPAVPTQAPPVAVAVVTPAPTAPASAEPVVDERFAKFVKMQKMLPEGAVRQKMMTEGFSADEIDSFFANGPPMVAPAPVAPAPVAPVSAAPVPDERYAKFVKMQKMLPEGAVRQKMMTEGFNTDEIDSFFTNGPPMCAAPLPAASAAAAAGAGAVPPPPPSAASAAPVADERYAKFVKMQKMLPEGAVRQKMMTEGFNQTEIDSFFANGPPMVASAIPAVSAAASAPEPDERYAKYVKMQKMLPEGAVRQKMAADGFTPAEVDSFFVNGPPMVAGAVPAVAAISAEPVVDERYAKFVKMQKMLPEGAVRQKMMTEGFNQTEIDSFFANGPPMVAGVAPAVGAGAGAPPPPPAPAAPAVVDERFAKYVKMQKMLPEGAVRQKMMSDGFSAADIESFFNPGAAPAGGAAAATPAAPKAPTLTPLEAIRFAKYEKMLKMLPEGAVRQKMVSEEVSPEDIDKFFGAMNGAAAAKAATAAAKPAAPKPPTIEPPPEGMSAKPKITPNAKLKGIFWTKLKNSDIKGTVWHKMQEHKLPAEEIKRLEELFGTKVAVVDAAAAEEKAAKAAAAEKKSGGKKLISVLDAQRTQNVMIIMGKVRKNAEQILKLVIDLDPETLNHELCHTLYEVLPTAEEVAAVQPHKDPSLLDNASQLLFQFNRMPRILQRMECHEIAFSWAGQANAAASQLGVIECACVELSKSQQNMQTLLSMVLSIGNYLNGGTARGEAYGVGLDIFSKFCNLKASQQNESLMHFLARQADLHDPHLSELSDQWVALWAAADISYKQLSSEVANLDTLVNKMNTEFTRIKDSKDNIGLDGKMEDCKGPAMNPLHRRLNGFLLTAKPRIAQIRLQVKNVESAVEKEMNKYGESLKKTADDDACKLFFSTIAQFARAYRTACDENAARRLAAEKANKAATDAAQKESSKTAPGGVPGGVGLPGMGGPKTCKAKTENIFGMFQASQEASSDDVIAEFKLKMAKRMAKNSS